MQQEAQDKADIKTQKPVLKAASYDATKIKLSWEMIPDTDGYILYRKTEETSHHKPF